MSGAPRSTPSTLNWTLATPAFAVAVASIVTGPDTVPAEGLVMETVVDGGTGVATQETGASGDGNWYSMLSIDMPPERSPARNPVNTTEVRFTNVFGSTMC